MTIQAKSKEISYNQSGLTIVEMLVALTLLSIVLAMGYSYFFFGNTTFNKGEAQSNMQRDIRQTAAFITAEVRYATEIEMIDTPTPSSGDGFHYISIEGSRIKYTDPSGNITYKTEAVLQELTPMFTLKWENSRNIMHFRLLGSDEAQTYKLETKALLYNIRGQAEASNQGFKYKKP